MLTFVGAYCQMFGYQIERITLDNVPRTNDEGKDWDACSSPDIVFEFLDSTRKVVFRSTVLQDFSLKVFSPRWEFQSNPFTLIPNIGFMLKNYDQDLANDDLIETVSFVLEDKGLIQQSVTYITEKRMQLHMDLTGITITNAVMYP